MARYRLVFSVLFAALFFFPTWINAQTESGGYTIVTPIPAPKESVEPPKGYTNCFTVGAGWYKGVWYPDHAVCQYDTNSVQSAQGDAWVAGHWACTNYSNQQQLKSQCTFWKWIEGHWLKDLPVY